MTAGLQLGGFRALRARNLKTASRVGKRDLREAKRTQLEGAGARRDETLDGGSAKSGRKLGRVFAHRKIILAWCEKLDGGGAQRVHQLDGGSAWVGVQLDACGN